MTNIRIFIDYYLHEKSDIVIVSLHRSTNFKYSQNIIIIVTIIVTKIHFTASMGGGE